MNRDTPTETAQRNKGADDTQQREEKRTERRRRYE